MNQKLVKLLQNEGYLTLKGERTRDYEFYPEDFDLEKERNEIRLCRELVTRLSDEEPKKFFSELETFTTAVRDYENAKNNFESGDYLAHVYLIKLKEECRNLMEQKGFIKMLW